MSDYIKEIMEAFRKKFELHDVGKSQFTICTNSGDNTCNGGVSVDEIELESAEKLLENIESFLSQALTRVEEAARKEEREKIKQAFINVYKGAGEVFFPYVSAGNCTAKEEQMAIEEEWEQIEDNIVTSPSEEKECEHDPIIDCGGNCHCGKKECCSPKKEKRGR